MIKKEIIWREILQKTLDHQVNTFTQKGLAEQFGFSLSTVFNAMAAPRQSGAIEVTGRFFRVRNVEKLLYFWATQRNLQKDIVYNTHSDLSVKTIESNMPNGVIFGSYSAYRLGFQSTPADYSIVYVYANDLSEIQRRFPKQVGYANIVVLKPDQFLSRYVQQPVTVTPTAQTFVDIWNTTEWYAKDFLDALKEQLHLG